MRVVVAHSPDKDVHEVRRALVGAGLDCSAEDCVTWRELPLRLAQSEFDLVVVETTRAGENEAGLIAEANALCSAPIFAIGPTNGAGEQMARQAGVASYIDIANLRSALDQEIRQMSVAQATATRHRGNVITVFAPSPGSGGTLVAAHLAAALTAKHSKNVGLLELARDGGDLAVLTDAKSEHWIGELCERWDSLDASILQDCAVDHKTGVQLLVNSGDQSGNPHLNLDSVRRLAVLARVAFPMSVFALDARYTDVEMEAMRLADHVALVIRPDVPAVRRARWALQQMEESGVDRDRVMLLVNRWGQSGQLKQGDIEETMRMKVAGLIPDDTSRVNRAVNRGLLLQEMAGRSPICKRLAALVKTLDSKTAASARS